MKTYILEAESNRDVGELLIALGADIATLSLVCSGPDGVDVTFTSSLPTASIQQAIAGIVDGHAMLRTLKVKF